MRGLLFLLFRSINLLKGYLVLSRGNCMATFKRELRWTAVSNEDDSDEQTKDEATLADEEKWRLFVKQWTATTVCIALPCVMYSLNGGFLKIFFLMKSRDLRFANARKKRNKKKEREEKRKKKKLNLPCGCDNTASIVNTKQPCCFICQRINDSSISTQIGIGGFNCHDWCTDWHIFGYCRYIFG